MRNRRGEHRLGGPKRFAHTSAANTGRAQEAKYPTGTVRKTGSRMLKDGLGTSRLRDLLAPKNGPGWNWHGCHSDSLSLRGSDARLASRSQSTARLASTDFVVVGRHVGPS